MLRITLVHVLAAIASAQTTVPSATAESPVAYQITVPVAVGALPAELRPFFETNLAALGASATPSIDTDKDRNRHSMPLDCAAEGKDSAERRAAAREFPRDRAAARELLGRCGRDGEDPLPWIIQQRFSLLVESMKRSDAEQIVRDSGALLHTSIDAALPFNATDEQWDDRPSAAGEERSTHPCTMRARYHFELVDRLRERLAFEARVAPQRVQRIDDPVAAVFDTLLAAHESALVLETLDRERAPSASREPRRAGDAAFLERIAPILETQIEAGALLGAELVYSAWVEAGKPVLPAGPTGSTARAVKGASAATSEASKSAAAFVGSRSSKTFHRATCRHVERIKSDRRVFFDTAAQARAQGRQPCKTCKPD